MMNQTNEEEYPPTRIPSACSSHTDGLVGLVSCMVHSLTSLITKKLELLMQLFNNQMNDIKRLELENKTIQLELSRLNIGLLASQQEILKSCQNKVLYQTGHRLIDTRYEGIPLRECNQNRRRSCTIRIEFPHAFASMPSVTLGLTMIDTSTNAVTRVKLAVKSVDKDHFDAELSTWMDSVVHAVEFDWVATNLGS